MTQQHGHLQGDAERADEKIGDRQTGDEHVGDVDWSEVHDDGKQH